MACGAFCKAWATGVGHGGAFRTNAERVQNRRELSSCMEPLMLEKTTQEWIELLRVCGDSLRQNSIRRGSLRRPAGTGPRHDRNSNHPKAGPIRVTGVPIKLL